MWEAWVQSLGWEDPLEKGHASTSVFLGFPGGSDGKESTCNVGDLGLIPGLQRSHGGGHGKPTPVFWFGEFITVHGVAKSWTQLSY